MRVPAEEKMETIRLVLGSDLSVTRTLKVIGVRRSTYYGWLARYLDGGFDALHDRKPVVRKHWNRILGMQACAILVSSGYFEVLKDGEPRSDGILLVIRALPDDG